MMHDWPVEFSALKDAVIKNFSIKSIRFIREFSAGKSGAKVYLLDVTLSGFDGMAVIKFDKSNTLERERENFDTLTKKNPDFTKKHVAEIIDVYFDIPTGNGVLLYKIAGSSLKNCYPLWEMSKNEIIKRNTYIQQNLLESQHDPVIDDSPIRVLDVFQNWLDYRIEKTGGRLFSFFQKYDLTENQSTFCFVDKCFPNPLYILENRKFLDDLSFKGIKGFIHGDFHGYNIISKATTETDYFLIDLALANNSNYLFFDQSYIELAYLLDNLETISEKSWIEFIEYQVKTRKKCDNDSFPDKFEEYLHAKNHTENIREVVYSWIHENHSNYEDDFETQFLLSRIGVGLNFANKDIEPKKRIKAYLYASIYLKELLTESNISLPGENSLINLAASSTKEKNESCWEDVFKSCYHFNPDKYMYVLMTQNINTENIEILSHIDWSLIFDFDINSQSSGLYSALNEHIDDQKTIHNFILRQTFDYNVKVNYSQSVSWFYVNGVSDTPESLAADLPHWKNMYQRELRKKIEEFYKETSPKPLVILVNSNNLEYKKAHLLLDIFAETYAKYASCNIVVLANEGSEFDDLKQEFSNVELVKCKLQHFVNGYKEIQETLPDYDSKSIPKRKIGTQKVEYFPLKKSDFSYFKEELELFYIGKYQNSTTYEPMKSFLRGSEISLSDLEYKIDIPRKIYPLLLEEILHSLQTKNVNTIKLEHTIGAGGTTLSRRVAFSVKQKYPVVNVITYSSQTIDRLEKIFNISNLPLFILLESSVAPEVIKSKLLTELQSRNIRATILYIRRVIKTRSDFTLSSPMGAQETSSFYKKYLDVADSASGKMLHSLSQDPRYAPYRIPFFYGFYTFFREYTQNSNFVENSLKALEEERKTLIMYIALISRFTQSGMPIFIFEKFLKLIDKTLYLYSNESDVFKSASFLINRNEQLVKILHPILAEEILKISLNTQTETAPNFWKNRLADLAEDFIEKIHTICGDENTHAVELISQLFLVRDYVPTSNVSQNEQFQKLRFSELIQTIPYESKQKSILTTITEKFPTHSHAWNHLGRFYLFEGNYSKAEDALNQAIMWDPENGIHYHTLGMTYRFTINDQLRSNDFNTLDLEVIIDLYEKANENFYLNRGFDSSKHYGYVTNIQMITEIIRALKRIQANDISYAEFFGRDDKYSTFCKDILSYAQDLIFEHETQKTVTNSTLEASVENDIYEFSDDYKTMIENYSNMLSSRHSTDDDKISIRRNIANAVLSSVHFNWNKLSQPMVQNISSLMEQNYKMGKASHLDILKWFQSSRHLENFDLNRAISMFEDLITIEPKSVNGYFYLYVFYFIEHIKNKINYTDKINTYIDKCRSLAGPSGRIYSHEWFTTRSNILIKHKSEFTWNHNNNFVNEQEKLTKIQGRIKSIKGPQSGIISIEGLDAFFVPGNEIYGGKNEESRVEFYLGFSYEGLRAWDVKILT